MTNLQQSAFNNSELRSRLEAPKTQSYRFEVLALACR